MTDSTRWLRTLLDQADPPTTGHRSQAAWDPPLDVLVHLDPITTAPDPDVIAAAIVYARRRHAEAEPQLLWARYASTAARTLWDKAHPTAIRAAMTYHNVLIRQGLTFDAVRIRQDQLDIYRELGDPTRILAARCGLALALHRDGQCDTAEEQIRLVLRQWWGSPHGYGHASMVLLVAASIHAGCGRTTEARQLLTRDAVHLAHLNPATGTLPRSGSPPWPSLTRPAAAFAHLRPRSYPMTTLGAPSGAVSGSVHCVPAQPMTAGGGPHRDRTDRPAIPRQHH